MQFTKVDVSILKLKAGESFIGKLTAISERPTLDKTTGLEKKITQFHFDELSDKGEVKGQIIYLADGGFKNTMSMSNIQTNDVVKVVKLQKVALQGGRSVNAYEIYKAN